MSRFYQNDTLNTTADQKMLHYLHKRTSRGKRKFFKTSVSKSSTAVRPWFNSLNRQTNSDHITPAVEATSIEKKETRDHSKLNHRAHDSASDDLQREAIRCTPKSRMKEERQNSPVEEEAQSLLRMFLNNFKDSENPADGAESTPETSRQAHSPQRRTLSKPKQDETYAPFVKAVDEKVRRNASFISSSKGSAGERARSDETSNSRKRRADGKLKQSGSGESGETAQERNMVWKRAMEMKPIKENVDGVNNDESCLFTTHFNVPNSQRDFAYLLADEPESKHHLENIQRGYSLKKITTFDSSSDEESNCLSQKPSLSDNSKSKNQPAVNENFTSTFLNLPSRELDKTTHASSSKLITNENQSETSQNMVSKRPRRANAAPVNYSLKQRTFSSQPEPEDMRVTLKASSSDLPKIEVEDSGFSRSTQEPITRRARVIHFSKTSRVEKEHLSSPVFKLFKKRHSATYRNNESREKIIQSYKNGEKVPPENLHLIIHVDFDSDEQEAMFSLISKVDPQKYNTMDTDTDTDMTVQDRIIQVAKAPDFSTSLMADRIDKMSQLQSRLMKNDTDPEQLLLNAKKGEIALSKIDSQTVSMLISQITGVPRGPTLTATMKGISEEFILKFVKQVLSTNSLSRRKRLSVERFLIDAKNQHLSTTPSLLRVSDPQRHEEPLDNMRHVARSPAYLRSREIGNQHYRTPRLENSKFRKQKSWKGASNDFIVLTWSPDGTRFAAGATAQCDTRNMIYNRGNNLILGDLTTNRLNELPDHWIPRPSTNDIADPRLYMSVSAVRWAGDDKLFTGSYDKTIKLWDVPNHSDAHCIRSFPHRARVQVMALSQYHSSLLAVGHDSDLRSFGYWNMTENLEEKRSPFTYTDLSFVSSHPGKKIELFPSSLVWGTSFSSKDYLVAGMSSNRLDDNADPSRDGFLTAWQVGESSFNQIQFASKSQNIFDIAWNPTLPYFATGSSIPTSGRVHGIGKSTRSLVRLYQPHKEFKLCEFECPAIDINDVSFCTANPNYISASCTDGSTYVWDFRNGDNILHKLSHGDPRSELDAGMTREQADVGVRVALWGNSTDKLFTGSSDGKLKSWNILRAREDALVQDIVSLDAEIMSGSFSPDQTNLLLGDASGGVHLLSASPFSSNSETETFDFISANDKMEVLSESENVGIKAAREYLATGQIAQDPVHGPGQGPNYSGPYAAWARPEGTSEAKLAETSLREEIQMEQRIHKLIPLSENRKRQAFQTRPVVKRHRRVNESKIFKKREVINLVTDDEDDEEEEEETDDDPQFISSIRRTISCEAETIPYELNTFRLDEEIEDLVERLEEDHWWPRNCDVDPNIKNSET